MQRAHPRSRGENTIARGDKIAGAGSSPLTRGKRASPHQRRQSRGLIPAHAGKTVRPALSLIIDRAHPRSRGENVLMGMIYSPEDGSSPLTRGKRSRRFRRGV